MEKMTNSEMTAFLVEGASVPEGARTSYAAGYFESTLQTLMSQFPEVRKEMEWRVDFLKNQMKGNV
jgi:hypothetical protein